MGVFGIHISSMVVLLALLSMPGKTRTYGFFLFTKFFVFVKFCYLVEMDARVLLVAIFDVALIDRKFHHFLLIRIYFSG